MQPTEANHSLPNKSGELVNISGQAFLSRMRILVNASWILPPFTSVYLLFYTGILTTQQIYNFIISPLNIAYLLGWLIFANYYLLRYLNPILGYLEHSNQTSSDNFVKIMQGFSTRFWGLYLVYFLSSPIITILTTEFHPIFALESFDILLIQLIALIAFATVALPIFFMLMDLFGKTLSQISIDKPYTSIKTKVFLIGALTPFLVGLMLILFFWSHTGFFEKETLFVWITLEMVAIAASVIYSKSIAQSLAPLNIDTKFTAGVSDRTPNPVFPRSTDELGVISRNYSALLQELRAYNEVFELSNNLLRELGKAHNANQSVDTIIRISEQVLSVDAVFLILHDESKKRLICVAYSNSTYSPNGYFELALDNPSIAADTFSSNQTINIQDSANDPSYKREMLDQFSVKSALSTPLRLDDKVVGVLVAISCATIVQFSSRDEMLLEALAKEAALAIHAHKLLDEKERAVEDRRQREALIKLLIASTEEGIYGVNLQGKCSFINRSALQMLGYADESQLLGENLQQLIQLSSENNIALSHADHPPSVTYGSRSGSNSARGTLTRRNGSQFPIEFWTHPVNKDGQLVATVVTFVDITERNRITEELDQHRNQLKTLVAQRTAEAERINKELESFSYSVSHDLRSPLRAMAGYSDILLEEYEASLDESGKDFLNRIKSNSKKMGLLIDDLLNLTRINRGKMKKELVNMSEIVKDLVRSYRLNDPSRTVIVEVEDNLKVPGDSGMIRIMLDNLIGNAWKYTSKLAKAQITFAMNELSYGVVEYYISDNGVGFDSAFTEIIFKEFQRLHSDLEFPGSGIGLATVKRVLDRHGGSIRVESEIGKGSCFYFTIPRHFKY